VRPFGVSLLLAGYDDNGPQLYQIDPSGSYFAWRVGGMFNHSAAPCCSGHISCWLEDVGLADAGVLFVQAAAA